MQDIETKTTRIPIREARKVIGLTEKIPIFDNGDGIVLVSKFILDENLLPNDSHALQAKSLIDLMARRRPTDTVDIPERGWDAIMVEYKKWTDP